MSNLTCLGFLENSLKKHVQVIINNKLSQALFFEGSTSQFDFDFNHYFYWQTAQRRRTQVTSISNTLYDDDSSDTDCSAGSFDTNKY